MSSYTSYVSQLTKSCFHHSQSIYPNFTPAINRLSKTTSASGTYVVVYIIGDNFTPYDTFVNFGTYTNLPITFFSSLQISFVVPIGALPGNYPVSAVNIYGSKLSKKVNYTYSNTLIYSNPINYTLT